MIDLLAEQTDEVMRRAQLLRRTLMLYFVPMVVKLPAGASAETTMSSFAYDASDPSRVAISGKGTEANPVVYTPAPAVSGRGRRMRGSRQVNVTLASVDQ